MTMPLLNDATDVAGAVLSTDGRYRYRLWRSWGKGETLVFLMLNPSTADAEADDPTIRKCIGFARRLGYEGIEVVNLFAWRSTDPRALRGLADAIGPENDATIHGRCVAASAVIAAWGATDFPDGMVRRRASEVVAMLRRARVEVLCLGRSKDGQPRHPLMLAYSTPLEVIEEAPR